MAARHGACGAIDELIVPGCVSNDIIHHGVEVKPDGTVFALVRVHHWCGNDPVRFHLARMNLSSLLLVLKEEDHPFLNEYGVDPAIFGMATIPHSELKESFERHHISIDRPPPD